MDTVHIHDGILYVDGRARPLNSADYPYYRDAPQSWKDRLQKLRDDCHVNVITFYIPWRHHQPEQGGPLDFDGHTQPNRNVHDFIRTCAELGLWCIAKPGPFIHAETNFGGLPDWVSPDNTPGIESFVDSAGKANTWSGATVDDEGFVSAAEWALPAPFDPVFMPQVRDWLQQAGEAVIRPHLHPNGPILAIQIANEGIYSDGQAAPWQYDFSPSAIGQYRQWLQEHYGDLDTYNSRHATGHTNWTQIEPPRQWTQPESLHAMLSFIDWGRFSADYLGEIYRNWGDATGVDCPQLVNLNPPETGDWAYDAWLTRVNPERWPTVQYGFTNWIGDVAADPTAFDRYLLTAKRVPGPNLEENWGFSKLYDPSYEDACTSFYQTLLAFAGGTTGYNVYTGVSTDQWDSRLDSLHERPYPAVSPITAAGEVTPKARTIKQLNLFMDQHGEDWLACRPQVSVAYGAYLPYAGIAAWLPADHAADLPVCGRGLRQFQHEMRQAGLDYDVVSLETASPDDLAACAHLVLHGYHFMARDVQEKLADYARNGGQLTFIGMIPEKDETFAACDSLTSLANIRVYPEADYGAWFSEINRPALIEGSGYIWIRSHESQDVHFAIVLIPKGDAHSAAFDITLGGKPHHLMVRAAPGGGAILRIEAGKVTDVLVKGINGWLRRAVTPACALDGDRIGLPYPGDLLILNGNSVT